MSEEAARSEAVHSFVIRIWLEEVTEMTGRPKWRGHITHIPSKRRHYINDLDEMKRFVASYLTLQDGASNRS